MIFKKLSLGISTETAFICLLIGTFWWSHILASDGDKEIKKEPENQIDTERAQIIQLENRLQLLEESYKLDKVAFKESPSLDNWDTRTNEIEIPKENPKVTPESPKITNEPITPPTISKDTKDSWEDSAPLAPAKTKDPLDHVYGSEDSRFIIYEYLDFDCPFCRDFFNAGKKYVEDSQGQLRIILRQFPLPMHGESAQLKAYTTECAGILKGNKAFWVASEEAFKKDFTVDGIADLIGVPLSELNHCLASEKSQEGIIVGMAEGNKLGITGTPGVVVLDTKTMLRHIFDGTPSESDIALVIAKMAEQDKRNQAIKKD